VQLQEVSLLGSALHAEQHQRQEVQVLPLVERVASTGKGMVGRRHQAGREHDPRRTGKVTVNGNTHVTIVLSARKVRHAFENDGDNETVCGMNVEQMTHGGNGKTTCFICEPMIRRAH
jgi:hypothetical protein